MASVMTPPVTVEQFEGMPDPAQPGKQELLEGELIQLPPAKEDHGNIVETLFLLLRSAAGFRVHMERGYQMPPHNWLVPDVSVAWPNQRSVNGYPQGSPMIAIEVVSPPAIRPEEVRSKITAYLTHGAAEVWVLYPRNRVMEVHTPAKMEIIEDAYKCETVPVAFRLSELLPRASSPG